MFFVVLRYKKCEDGFFRLQTERYESVELTAELDNEQEKLRQEETEDFLSRLIEEDSGRPEAASTPLPVFSRPSIPSDLRNITNDSAELIFGSLDFPSEV